MKNVSLDLDATIGCSSIKSKDFICENKDTITTGLKAVFSMVKNPFAKMAASLLIDLIEFIINKHCNNLK